MHGALKLKNNFLIKVCGITRPEFAEFTAAAGADAIGVIHSPKSVRHISDAALAAEITAVAHAAGKAAVLVSAELPVPQLLEFAAAAQFDVLQLHGPAYKKTDFDLAHAEFGRVWRAASLQHEPQLVAGACGEELTLLDSPAPGSGKAWDVSLLAAADLHRPWLLAGGLSPANVSAAIAACRPDGVDVASGVESAPGKKDETLVRDFVRKAKAAVSKL